MKVVRNKSVTSSNRDHAWVNYKKGKGQKVATALKRTDYVDDDEDEDDDDDGGKEEEEEGDKGVVK